MIPFYTRDWCVSGVLILTEDIETNPLFTVIVHSAGRAAISSFWGQEVDMLLFSTGFSFLVLTCLGHVGSILYIDCLRPSLLLQIREIICI